MTTPQPDTLKTMLDELDRRLRALETAPRLIHSSIKNGTLRLLDSNGVTRLFIGSVNEVESGGGTQGDPPPNLYGVTMRDANGGYCLEISGSGFGLPEVPLPFYQRLGMVAGGNYIDITNGAFQAVYQANLTVVMWDAIRVGITCLSDAGTTGEIRLRNTTGGGASSAAVTIPAGSAGTRKEFVWTHQQPMFTGPFVPVIEVRRTGGAGAIHVYPPDVTAMCSTRWSGATTTG